MAVSIFALLLAHGFQANLTAQLAHSGLPVEVPRSVPTNQARLHDMPIPAGLTLASVFRLPGLLDGAFLAGFRSVMLACAISPGPGAGGPPAVARFSRCRETAVNRPAMASVY